MCIIWIRHIILFFYDYYIMYFLAFNLGSDWKPLENFILTLTSHRTIVHLMNINAKPFSLECSLPKITTSLKCRIVGGNTVLVSQLETYGFYIIRGSMKSSFFHQAFSNKWRVTASFRHPEPAYGRCVSSWCCMTSLCERRLTQNILI